MASQGVNNGTLVGIWRDGVLISKGTTHSISINNDMIDITSKDSSGWREVMAGLRSWTLSGEFRFAEDSTVAFADLFSEITARTSFGIRFSTGVTGDLFYHGIGLLSSLELSGDTEDGMTFSASFEGTGTLTETAAS